MRSERSAPPAAKNAARASHRKPAPGCGRAAYFLLFIFLAIAAAQSARLGVAGLFTQLGQLEIDRWASLSRSPNLAEVKRSERFISDSLGYAADNPWALETAGALDLAKMRASKTPREALAATKDAHSKFRQALRQRPTSPFLWANLALTKLYLNEIDGELLAALRLANELGPWEPTVQQTALFVGLAVWQELDTGLRETFMQAIERGALRDPQKMLEIVKSYRRLDLICGIGKYEVIAGPDCRKATAAANSGELMKPGQHQ